MNLCKLSFVKSVVAFFNYCFSNGYKKTIISIPLKQTELFFKFVTM